MGKYTRNWKLSFCVDSAAIFLRDPEQPLYFSASLLFKKFFFTETVFILLSFFILREREREIERASGQGTRERERENPKQVLSYQHRAWCRAQTHKTEIMTWAETQSWTVNHGVSQAPLLATIFYTNYTILLQYYSIMVLEHYSITYTWVLCFHVPKLLDLSYG